MELYRGASEIDGGRIVAISTESKNQKTGKQVQIWILSAQGMDPLQAVENNVDRSVCGDCKHRSGTCYVVLAWAPLAIYQAWQEGKYEKAQNADYLKGRMVRFGAYGDPAALPLELVKEIASKAKGYTGYTHQWKMPHVQPYKDYLMASVDSLEEYKQAKAMGWRTFRVKNASESKQKQEIVCPASNEAGKKSTCEKCGLCSGLAGKGSKDIVINVHGLDFKIARFQKISLQMAA
jgi:hypothetical protein